MATFTDALKKALDRCYRIHAKYSFGSILAALLPTQDQKDALAGTSGTTPSSTNKFVDAADKSRLLEYIAQVDVGDLTASALSQAVALTNFPANALVAGSCVEVDTPFSGGGATSASAKVGDAGDDDELMGETSIFTGVSGLVGAAPAGEIPRFENGYAPLCTITSDVNVDTLTAGVLQVHIFYRLVGPATP